MPQIALPTTSIKISLGKRKQRSQMCEMFTDDGRIVTIEEPVLRGCMDDPDKGMGFLIDEANQFTAEDGTWTQILGERSTLPLCLITKSKITDTPNSANDPLRKLIDQIFHESQEAEKLNQYVQAARNIALDKITQIVAIVCSAMLLIYGFNHFWGK